MEGGIRCQRFFYRDAAEGYAALANAIRSRFADLFDGNRQDGGVPVEQSAGQKLAKQNENGFIQRTLINQRYGVNCMKLTMWEYLLLIEHTSNSKD